MSKARELASLGNAYSDGSLSNRNLIINGAMQVAQRGAGPVSVSPYQYNTADRMRFSSTGGTIGTWTQEVVSGQDVGDFVGNALKSTCTVAGTSGNVAGLNIRLELNDIKRFVGKTLTLSFYAKADATVSMTPLVYGDTTATMDTFNLTPSYVRYETSFAVPPLSTVSFFDLVMRVDGTVATTHYITGVQLEVGDTATPFEHRSYGQELALCQRYYWRPMSKGAASVPVIRGYVTSGTQIGTTVMSPTTMRAAPSIQVLGTWAAIRAGQPTISNQTIHGVELFAVGTTTGTGIVYPETSDDGIELDAEL